MLDFNHIPKRSTYTNLIFTDVNSTAASLIGQFWVKPRGTTFVQILCVGGGGGGAGGTLAATGSFGGGGGGGGSAFSVVLIPTYQIPDKLNIRIGLGGTAGAVGGNGATGGATKVKLGHIGITNSALANDNIDVICQVNGAPGGSIGTTLVGGPAGVSTQTSGGSTSSGPLWLSSIGNVSFNHMSSAGGFTGVGGDIIINSSATGQGQPWPFSIGGCGGGGIPLLSSNLGNAGGGYVKFIDTNLRCRMFPDIAGGAGGSTASSSGSRGQDGFAIGLESLSYSNGSESFKYYSGGTGGGSSGGTSGQGAAGGNGFMGSGGGGGGSGRAAGSVGGRGGSGFCIITAW